MPLLKASSSSGAVRMRNSWKYPISWEHLLPSAERKAEKTLQAQPRHVDLNLFLLPESSLQRWCFNRAPVVYWIYLVSGINKPVRIRPSLFKPPPTSQHPDPERHTMWDCCSPPARPFRTFQNKAWVSSNCALQQPGSRGNCWNGRCRPPAAGTDASTSTRSLETETEIPRTGSSVWGERILLDQTVEVMLMMCWRWALTLTWRGV